MAERQVCITEIASHRVPHVSEAQTAACHILSVSVTGTHPFDALQTLAEHNSVNKLISKRFEYWSVVFK